MLPTDLLRRALGRLRRGGLRPRGIRPWLFYRGGPRLASRLRKRWAVFRNPQATIRFLGPVYLGPGFSLQAERGSELVVGPSTEFRRGFRAELRPGARLSVGAGCYFTYDVVISCATRIEIGERVGLAQATFVSDERGPLRIADDAQVHSKATILADLGERVIVGANAAVTEVMPPYTVVGGVPARVIDYYGPPGREPEGWRPRADAAAG